MPAAKQGQLVAVLVDDAVCEHADLTCNDQSDRRVRLESEGALVHDLVVLVSAEDNRAGETVDGGRGVPMSVEEEGLVLAHRRTVGGLVVDEERRAVEDRDGVAAEEVSDVARLIDAFLHAQVDFGGLPRVRADQPSAAFLFNDIIRREPVSLLGDQCIHLRLEVLRLAVRDGDRPGLAKRRRRGQQGNCHQLLFHASPLLKIETVHILPRYPASCKTSGGGRGATALPGPSFPRCCAKGEIRV